MQVENSNCVFQDDEAASPRAISQSAHPSQDVSLDRGCEAPPLRGFVFRRCDRHDFFRFTAVVSTIGHTVACPRHNPVAARGRWVGALAPLRHLSFYPTPQEILF